MRRISSATAVSPETGEFYWMRITSFKPGATISIDSRVTYAIDSLAGYFVDKNGMPWKRVEWTGTVNFELGDDPNEEYPGAVNPPGSNGDSLGNPSVIMLANINTTQFDANGNKQVVFADLANQNTTAVQSTSNSALLTDQPAMRSVVAQPAVATQASASQAAVANVRHIARRVTINLEANAAQGDIIFNLRDGASGAGAILWSIRLALAAGVTFAQVFDLGHLQGSTNTAMTLESAAAPALTNFAGVVLETSDMS